MTEPRVIAAPGQYSVTWTFEDSEVCFEADSLRAHSDGSVRAFIRITATLDSGEELPPLHYGVLNMSAGRSRTELSRNLEKRLPRDSILWDRVIEESCRLIVEREREGVPAERLGPVDHVEPEYLLPDLLLDHQPTLVYGPGGAGKSYVAMLLALCVENGLPFLGTQPNKTTALYLDWEVDQHEAARRCTQLASGLGVPGLRFPLYRRCVASIQDEARAITKDVVRHNVGLVVIDSAGAACGGDILSAETVSQLFTAARRVTAPTNAATLVLTHVTKAERSSEDQRRLPFGSIYFENLARASWELRSEEHSDGRGLHLSLNCRKNNMSRPAPLGMRLTFERDAVRAEPATAKDVPTAQGATRDLILAELSHGQASLAELVEATGLTSNQVSVALNRMGEEVVRVGRGVYQLDRK